MSGIQLTGLASGLDWKSLVDSLIAAERIPQNQLVAQKATGVQKTTALETLKTRLTDLQTSIKGLGSGGSAVFGARSAKLDSADSTWSASAATGTETGTYSFTVSQLATKAQLTGASDKGKALSTTTDVSAVTVATLPVTSPITAGEFTVNGARITVAPTDSLQDVFTRISTQTSGAVTGSYDPSTDKIKLSGTGEVVLGSANDTSNFLTALQLYNNGSTEVISPKALGVVSVSTAIVNANLRLPVTGVDGSGNGSFQVNGVNIDYNVNTDSLQTILGKINNSTAGVTAAFDKANDRFTLSNKTTGDLGISISEGAGGLLESLGLKTGSTLNRGQNALFSIDGGDPIVSNSNTLDASVHGITGLSVTATSETTQAVTVGSDTSALRTQITDFVAKFNALQSTVDGLTKSTTDATGKVTKSVLTGNREVSGISTDLRRLVFDAVPGLTGSVKQLENLGIDFSNASTQLTVKDAAKLDRALADHPDDVQKLFTDSTNGLATRLDTYLTKATGDSGTISTQTKTIAQQSVSLDAQIAAMERRLTQERSLLESGFIQMEQAQSNSQNQLAQLTNAFGGSNK